MGNNLSTYQDTLLKQYYQPQVRYHHIYGNMQLFTARDKPPHKLMQVSLNLSHFSTSKKEQFMNNLASIINCPISNCTRIYHYYVKLSHPLQCKYQIVHIFADYYQLSLESYLNTLRYNKQHLSLSQLRYILSSLLKAMTALRKMRIDEFHLSGNAIYLGKNGLILINPIEFIFVNLYKQQPIGNNDSSISSNNSLKISMISQQEADIQKQQLLDIFLLLAQHLSPEQLFQSRCLYDRIQQSNSLQILTKLIDSEQISSETTISEIPIQRTIRKQNCNKHFPTVK